MIKESMPSFRNIPLVSISILALLCAYYAMTPEGADPTTIWICLSIFYGTAINSLLYRSCAANGIKTYLRTDTLFLSFSYILFFYPYQLWVLGLGGDIWKNKFVIYTFPECTNHAIVLATIASVSFQIGYLVSIQNKSNNYKQHYPSTATSAIELLTTISLTIALLAFLATGYSTLAVGAYAGSDTSDKATNGSYFLATHFSVILASLYIFRKKNNQPINPSLATGATLATMWSILLLILGDRNAFFLIAIASIGGYYTLVKEISIVKVITFALGAMLLYSTVEVTRKLETKDLSSLANAVSELMNPDESSKEPGDNSFSITTTTVRASIQHSNFNDTIHWGKFKLIGFSGIVPLSRSLFVNPNDDTTTSAEVLSRLTLGDGNTWSVGSNIISDTYMDFGLTGLVGCLFLVGYFGGMTQRLAFFNGENPLYICLYLYTLALYSELPRYALDFPARNIAWMLMYFWIGRIFIKGQARPDCTPQAPQ